MEGGLGAAFFGNCSRRLPTARSCPFETFLGGAAEAIVRELQTAPASGKARTWSSVYFAVCFKTVSSKETGSILLSAM